jgi:hypothetical protein
LDDWLEESQAAGEGLAPDWLEESQAAGEGLAPELAPHPAGEGLAPELAPHPAGEELAPQLAGEELAPHDDALLLASQGPGAGLLFHVAEGSITPAPSA